MRCIFCLEQRAAGDEHVFPLAVGGTLRTDRVCEACNSYLGSKVDAPLVNHLPIAHWRHKLGLAGNSGKVPDVVALLFANPVTLVTDPTMRLAARVNPRTGRLEARLLHSVSENRLGDGTVERRVSVDANDVEQIKRVVQAERKRAGKPPFPPDQLAAELENLRRSARRIDEPEVHGQIAVNFAAPRPGFVKIAYELAHRWLGESYLDDPTAPLLREVVLGKAGEENGVQMSELFAPDEGPFALWPADTVKHLAISAADGQTIAIAIKVFETCAAVVVSRDGGRHRFAQEDMRFLQLDPVRRTHQETTLSDQTRKLFHALPAAAPSAATEGPGAPTTSST